MKICHNHAIRIQGPKRNSQASVQLDENIIVDMLCWEDRCIGMKIQVLDESDRLSDGKDGITVRPFAKLEAFDAYDVTVISFQGKEIWENSLNNTHTVEAKNDIQTVYTAMKQAQKCKTVILFPQNEVYKYKSEYDYGKRVYQYTKTMQLKDMLPDVQEGILGHFFNKSMSLVFGKSATNILGAEFASDFYFKLAPDAGLSSRANSNAAGLTIVNSEDRDYYSTLLVDSNEKISILLNFLFRSPQEKEYPEWLESVTFLNEEVLSADLQKWEKQREAALHEISEINKELEAITEFKSILCTKGLDLETKVREMLQEMLEDNSEYVDKKEEDYTFANESIVFVFEIKGSDGGLRRGHVSKTNDHVQIMYDKLEDAGEDKEAKGILIFSDNIMSDPSSRDEYPEKQVTLAERDNILIIPASIFLKMYEAHRRGELSFESFIDILTNQTGLCDQEAA